MQRQLLTILFFFLSGFFLFKAGFLTIEHFVIVPNNSALYAYAKTTNSPDEASEASSSTENNPEKLEIPDQKIALPIMPSSIVNGEWQVSTQGVSLLSQFSEASNHGLVLFGHDWPVLLGRMRQSKIGEHVSLTYKDGTKKTYRIESVFSVSPTQLDILNLAKPDTVLIYTCSGFMDSKRFVVLAQLI